MRKLRSPFTTRHTPANHSRSFLNSGESGVMVCKVVNEYGIPNWRRLVQAAIFPQKLSRRCVLAMVGSVAFSFRGGLFPAQNKCCKHLRPPPVSRPTRRSRASHTAQPALLADGTVHTHLRRKSAGH